MWTRKADGRKWAVGSRAGSRGGDMRMMRMAVRLMVCAFLSPWHRLVGLLTTGVQVGTVAKGVREGRFERRLTDSDLRTRNTDRDSLEEGRTCPSRFSALSASG